MEQSSEKLWSLRHSPQGPLVPYLDAYAQRLCEQGFQRRTIAPQIRLIAYFSQWLKANHIGLADVTDEHAQQFQGRLDRDKSISGGSFAALGRFMTLLHQLDVIDDALLPCAIVTPIDLVINAFGQDLRQTQGLSKATQRQYIPFIEDFLEERFGTGCVDLAKLRAIDVVEFIKNQATRLSQARAKCATIALRSFLRYLRYRGEIVLDLAAAVPTVPNWSMTAISRAMEPEHVRAVLASCQRDTAVGCRDYAILLLLARLGLRSGEVVSLTLESIDWELGCLKVIGSKGGRISQLPLPADVGQAIADYLQHHRAHSNCRALFLRATAPIQGLGSQTSICSIVIAAIARAGINTRHAGAHQFRHSLACEMLRQGATLTEIGSLLRHRHTKTTGIYAKVDFNALRPLSLAWPTGGAQ